MGGLSIWHWIIVGGVVFVLFGGKFKISDVMGDVAKGIKAFKKGMSEDDEPSNKENSLNLDHQESRVIEAEKSAENHKL
ncbi:MAG: twin-arginine translocase TatA/TatE family subunit [Methylocystis sp.]